MISNVPCIMLTAGLKRPPETRKKIHTLTASEKPNASAMNRLRSAR